MLSTRERSLLNNTGTFKLKLFEFKCTRMQLDTIEHTGSVTYAVHVQSGFTVHNKAYIQ